MLPPQGHEANPQSCLNQAACCATQRETKWQAPERKAKKYAPATIREAHIAVPEVLGQLCFNTQQQSVSNRLPSSKQMEDRSGGKKTFKMTKV